MWFLVLIHIGSNNQRNCNGTGTPTPLKSNMNKFLNFELRDFVLQELLYCNLVATFCARTCCFRFKSSCSNASSPFRFFWRRNLFRIVATTSSFASASFFSSLCLALPTTTGNCQRLAPGQRRHSLEVVYTSHGAAWRWHGGMTMTHDP